MSLDGFGEILEAYCDRLRDIGIPEDRIEELRLQQCHLASARNPSFQKPRSLEEIRSFAKRL